eukprot:11635264-Alexandrium_andersonii.AAC.1
MNRSQMLGLGSGSAVHALLALTPAQTIASILSVNVLDHEMYTTRTKTVDVPGGGEDQSRQHLIPLHEHQGRKGCHKHA